VPGAEERTEARSLTLFWAGYLAYRQFDFAAAKRLAEESLTVGRVVNSPREWGRATMLLANLARETGDFAEAHALYEQAEQISRDVGFDGGEAILQISHGLAFLEEANFDEARRRIAAGLRLIRQYDNPSIEASALQGMARAAAGQGDLASAVSLLRESLALSRTVDDPNVSVWSLRYLGLYELDRGDRPAARQWLIEALALARDCGDLPAIARCLDGLGEVSAATDRSEAVRFAAAAEALRERCGALINPSEQRRRDRWLEAARQALGTTRFATAWSRGQRQPLEEILHETLRTNAPPTLLVPPKADDPLTRREREIVQLLARGLAASEIAHALVISHGTVRSHIEHAMTKLNLHSRVQLAAWAIHHGLVNNVERVL
jgi:DNA-binding CsgD family transcriptional regulator